MCFGLRNAAQTFQRLINSIVGDLDFVFAYVDDVLIASSTETEHRAHVREVFAKFGIAVNPAKCVFAADKLLFLGHIVDSRGSRPNPQSVDDVRRWPLPGTKKELQRFLGSLNIYHRFIPHAAVSQTPLFALIEQVPKNDGPITWTDEARGAFRACREALANTAYLAHPLPDAPLRLSTDAVLEQQAGAAWQPLGFFSRKLSPAQARYSAYDRELLAAYLATSFTPSKDVASLSVPIIDR